MLDKAFESAVGGENRLGLHDLKVALAKIFPIAAPGVIAGGAHEGLHRILVNVADHGDEVGFVFHWLAFKALHEEVPFALVFLIEVRRVL